MEIHVEGLEARFFYHTIEITFSDRGKNYQERKERGKDIIENPPRSFFR